MHEIETADGETTAQYEGVTKLLPEPDAVETPEIPLTETDLRHFLAGLYEEVTDRPSDKSQDAQERARQAFDKDESTAYNENTMGGDITYLNQKLPRGPNPTDEQQNQFFTYVLEPQKRDVAETSRVRKESVRNGGGGEAETDPGGTYSGNEGRSTFAAEAGERGQTVRVFKATTRSRSKRRSRLGRFTLISNPKEQAAQIVAELEILGVPAFVHGGDLEILTDFGNVVSPGEEIATINKSEVAVPNDVDEGVIPRETAGHEAFHYWGETSDREEFELMLAGNVDIMSEAYGKLVERIERLYFPNEVYDSGDVKHKARFIEEINAHISGYIHDNNVPQGLLYNEDEVRQAWARLVESQRGRE